MDRLKVALGLSVVLVGVVGLTGCIVINKTDGWRGHCPPPCGGQPNPELDSTMAEIEVAGRLVSDSAKKERLAAIAARPNLPEPAQMHLVETAFCHLVSESGKMAVLESLINNPAFSQVTKQKILDDLHRLVSESNKERILQWIDQRESAVPPPVPQTK